MEVEGEMKIWRVRASYVGLGRLVGVERLMFPRKQSNVRLLSLSSIYFIHKLILFCTEKCSL